MFIEGYEPDALHVFSQLMYTRASEVNTIIVSLFHQRTATLIFH